MCFTRAGGPRRWICFSCTWRSWLGFRRSRVCVAFTLIPCPPLQGEESAKGREKSAHLATIAFLQTGCAGRLGTRVEQTTRSSAVTPGGGLSSPASCSSHAWPPEREGNSEGRKTCRFFLCGSLMSVSGFHSRGEERCTNSLMNSFRSLRNVYTSQSCDHQRSRGSHFPTEMSHGGRGS